ncbi:MAG: purine-nucleoside phosphorylase [Candidatus Eisenbacteria bacterium]|nr:purine-nucleoside phosphorylase [Candidatus Eisenbacteria bacterium]
MSRSRVREAAAELRRFGVEAPAAGIVLGSGLSSFVDGLAGPMSLPLAELPGAPVTSVGGHRGAVVRGSLAGREVVALAGRVHYYEGRGVDEVAFGVRLLAELGVETLILTNASGGIDTGFSVGDLVLIADQIGLIWGRAVPGETFRAAGAYSKRLRALARDAAFDAGVPVRDGVYLGVLGPSYETPAEIAFARRTGASCIGMSTVTEAAEAHRLGLELLGVALVTNIPLPGRAEETTHDEVLASGRTGAKRLLSLVSGVLERL